MKVHNKTKGRKAVLTEDGYVVLKPDAKADFKEVHNVDALVKAGVSVSEAKAPKAKLSVKSVKTD